MAGNSTDIENENLSIVSSGIKLIYSNFPYIHLKLAIIASANVI